MQQAIQISEIFGNLAPFAVAAAVFAVTKAHYRWLQISGTRAAAVEDQKLRLSLLDRRLIAIEAIRFAHSDFWLNGHVATESVTKLYEALRIAEVVFDQAEEHAIIEIIGLVVDWQRINHRVRAASEREDITGASSQIDRQSEIEDAMIEKLPKLRDTLLKATRITMVEPFAEPTSKPQWLPRWQSDRSRRTIPPPP